MAKRLSNTVASTHRSGQLGAKEAEREEYHEDDRDDDARGYDVVRADGPTAASLTG
jgi:hypothetical protein